MQRKRKNERRFLYHSNAPNDFQSSQNRSFKEYKLYFPQINYSGFAVASVFIKKTGLRNLFL